MTDTNPVTAMRCPECGRYYDPRESFCSSDGTRLEARAASDPLIGQLLGDRYRLQRVLGKGGMGVVYLAEQVGVNRSVAVKVLRRASVGDAVAHGRFLREAKITATLRSPHTVTVYDFGVTEGGEPYLAMELLEGHTLRSHLAAVGPMSLQDALAVIDQTARSLSEAHDRGLVHRDLKPDNIFLADTHDYPTFVKVLDFGIAATLDAEETTKLTRTSEVPGTPAYVAPERISGETVDERADVYALGVILYELLTGEPPFKGQTHWEVLQAHLEQVPPKVELDGAGEPLPEPVNVLLARCLAKSPRLRPADAGELRERLAACAGADAMAATTPVVSPMTLPKLVTNNLAPEPQATGVGIRSEPAPKRSIWPWAAAAVLALVIGWAGGRLTTPDVVPEPPGEVAALQVRAAEAPEPDPKPTSESESESESEPEAEPEPEPEPSAAQGAGARDPESEPEPAVEVAATPAGRLLGAAIGALELTAADPPEVATRTKRKAKTGAKTRTRSKTTVAKRDKPKEVAAEPEATEKKEDDKPKKSREIFLP